jgi:hypothetical protein
MEEYLVNDNVVCIYRFGSYVYGTNNEFSDEDFVVILKEYQESKDDNIHHFSEVQFQDLVNRHDVQALECIFLPANLILKQDCKFNFVLDKAKLRISISTIASNSWVKGKKKLVVIDDYDLNLGLKSIFHALRILDLGIQIAEHKKIINYLSMNYVLDDLNKLSKAYHRTELWDVIDAKYRKLFNSKSSLFKDLCPKDLNEANKRKAIEALFSKYGVSNLDLIDQIMQIL